MSELVYIRPAREVASYAQDLTLEAVVRLDVSNIEAAWRDVLEVKDHFLSAQTMGEYLHLLQVFEQRIRAFEATFVHAQIDQLGVRLSNGEVSYVAFCKARTVAALEGMVILYNAVDEADEQKTDRRSTDNSVAGE